MRAVIQRVLQASVTVDGEVTAQIGPGMLVFLGVGKNDVEADAERLASKIVHLRIFPDEAGKMNRGLLDTRGECLIVSQFTLFGDTSRGRRPSFDQAADSERAFILYEHFVRNVQHFGLSTSTGRFQRHMLISSNNDGPVTFLCES